MNSIKSNNNNTKEIDLSIMLIPEMVKVIRLTVSGIASTIGFKIDDIEDIKVAVSEICNRIIVQEDKNMQRCTIRFIISDSEFRIKFGFEDHKPRDFVLFGEDDNFGFDIVNSLMDEVIPENADSKDIISLVMHLKERVI